MERTRQTHPLRTTIVAILAVAAIGAVVLAAQPLRAHADTSGAVGGEAYTADASVLNDLLSINELNDVMLPPGGSAGASINASSAILSLTSGTVATNCTNTSNPPASLGATCSSTIEGLDLSVDIPIVGSSALIHADALTATATAGANNAPPTATAGSSVTNLSVAGAADVTGTVSAPSTINLSALGGVVTGTVAINSTSTTETATSATGTAITLQIHLTILDQGTLDLTVGYASAHVDNVVVTGTATPTPTGTASATSTGTASSTATPSATASSTATPSTTASVTPTGTASATRTASPSPTSSATPTRTSTSPSGSPTSTPTGGHGPGGPGTPPGGANGGGPGGHGGSGITPRPPRTGNAGPAGSNNTAMLSVFAAIVAASILGLGAYFIYARRD